MFVVNLFIHAEGALVLKIERFIESHSHSSCFAFHSNKNTANKELNESIISKVCTNQSVLTLTFQEQNTDNTLDTPSCECC